MNEAALVDAVLEAHRQAALMPLPSEQAGGLNLEAAYRIAMVVEQRRRAAGDEPRGWKIGFTNRSIWPRYQVHQPIWGRVWRSTLVQLDGARAEVPLAGLVQPRIEPEIVFGFKAAPRAGMAMGELIGCLDWVAHGVEIVHTHYAGWRFGGAPDTVVDFGLHGRLLVGPRVPVTEWSALSEDLAALTMTVTRGGTVIDRGHGALVLDGPVNALQQWLHAMAKASPAWRVAAGEVVTTGTLTDAWPVAAGERWATQPDDTRLAGLELNFVDGS